MNDLITLIKNNLPEIIEYAFLLFILYFVSPFLKAKSKSLVTKGDIEEITNKIKGVENRFDEYQKKFSLYEEKKFLTIEEIYSKAHDLYKNTKRFTDLYQSDRSETDQMLVHQYHLANQELINYYHKKNIYLEKDLCDSIEEILSNTRDAHYNLRFGYAENLQDEELLKAAKEISDEKLPKLLEEFEMKLRNMLSAKDIKEELYAK